MIYRKKTEIGLILLGGIVLCLVAFQNNFPLVYSDTGDYIGSAFGRYIPIDRPIFYGLFIRLVSLQRSLWLVICAQGLLTSYITFETFTIFFSGNRRNAYFFASICLLTLFTGISHNVSILLPDIFCPVSALCFINILLNRSLSKIRMAAIAALMLVSMLFAYSNAIVITILFALVLFMLGTIKLCARRGTAIAKGRLVLCSSLLAGFFIFTPAANYLFGKKFIISEGSHVFMMNHLLETGILEDYLNRECGKKNYALCRYKDNLDTAFMWSGNSPLYKMGGWLAVKQEYDSIIYDIFTTPRYDLMILQRFTEYAFIQYFTFGIPGAHSWGNGSPLIQIKEYYKPLGRDYCASLQYHSWLNFTATSEIQNILVMVSLTFLILVLLTGAWRNMLCSTLKWFSVILIAYTVINAAVCANFSTLNERFQDRLVWLLPLTAFFVAEHLLRRDCSGNPNKRLSLHR